MSILKSFLTTWGGYIVSRSPYHWTCVGYYVLYNLCTRSDDSWGFLDYLDRGTQCNRGYKKMNILKFFLETLAVFAVGFGLMALVVISPHIFLLASIAFLFVILWVSIYKDKDK
jgi:hypothetical protein